MTATKNIEDAVRRWRKALDSVKLAEQSLRSAQCELENSGNDLGAKLAPSNMAPDEEIGIWVRFDNEHEGIVTVTNRTEFSGGPKKFSIRVREEKTRPESSIPEQPR